MAKIITIAHQKGGVGKSTLALNLAYRFNKNVSTALTDTDLQGTISSLKSIVDDFDIIDFNTIEALKKSDYKVVFVDTPPYLTNSMLPIFEQSDFVLIPTKMGVPDIMAISKTIEFIEKAQLTNPKLKSGIVLNMVKPNAKIKNLAIEQLKKYKLPILTPIHDRVSYATTFLEGGVSSSNDKNAILEIDNLTNQILNLL